MRHTLLFILIMLGMGLTAQQYKKAYQLFDSSGKVASYDEMIQDFAGVDVVFIGELHNNSISHWMEIEITKSLFETKQGNITLGAEMFESDTQLMLTEYVSGVISTQRFEADNRLWRNYPTDYKPLVEFAKDNKLSFIATNIPRRYADIVNKSGGEQVLNELTDEAKQFIAPLPIPFKPDSVMITEWTKAGLPMGKSTLGIAKAQAVKDATMAWFIAQHASKEHVFIHYNGSFHSDNHDGIIWFLKLYRPCIRIRTLATIEQEGTEMLDSGYKNRADYILCVPRTMTKTY
jgi:uncharacterized iron-regulated protein